VSSCLEAVLKIIPCGSLRRRLLAALCLPLVLALAGCHRGSAMYHVRGHVFYKDGTVPRGGVAVVVFRPKQDTTAEIRKGASGAIRPDGSFELWTKQTNDGAYKGEYDVGFTVLKSPSDPKPLLLEKYATPGAAGYSVTVDHDIDDLKFEIEPQPGVTGAAPTTGG
jgi:hypothetical protein